MRLTLHSVTKQFRTRATVVHALRGITLEFESGEYVAITGPSGSGKSTLLSILGCLEVPTSGTYCIDGRDVTRMNDAQRSALRARTFGFVFQTFHLIPDKTALENVALPMVYTGLPRHERRRRAQRLLDKVGMAHRAQFRAHQLSGGEQQRVAVARALANDPHFILADEPTGNLDHANRDEVLALLESLWREGRSLVIVTHDPEVAARAKRRIELRDGAVRSDTAQADTDATE